MLFSCLRARVSCATVLSAWYATNEISAVNEVCDQQVFVRIGPHAGRYVVEDIACVVVVKPWDDCCRVHLPGPAKSGHGKASGHRKALLPAKEARILTTRIGAACSALPLISTQACPPAQWTTGPVHAGYCKRINGLNAGRHHCRPCRFAGPPSADRVPKLIKYLDNPYYHGSVFRPSNLTTITHTGSNPRPDKDLAASGPSALPFFCTAPSHPTRCRARPHPFQSPPARPGHTAP